MRVGRSYLNGHSHIIGQAESPQCDCGDPHESPQHVLLSCPFYESQRQIMLSTITPIIPGFHQKSQKLRTEILLFGVPPDSTDSFTINRTVTLSVQLFLTSINRLEVWSFSHIKNSFHTIIYHPTMQLISGCCTYMFVYFCVFFLILYSILNRKIMINNARENGFYKIHCDLLPQSHD